MPIVSVIVITYNPVWEKLRKTLKSVLWQKNVNFEVVIADDGSKNDFFEQATQYMQEANFTNYRFVKNLQNQGTVKNLLSGIKDVKSKYVKVISPGDFFYNDSTLERMVAFAERNPAAFYFCNRLSYSVDENAGIKLYDDKKEPKNLSVWLQGNIKKIRWGYLVYQDYLCGATCLYNTKCFLPYLTQMSSFVTYAEDFSVVYMLANNEMGYFIPDCGGVWYECNTGISNQKDDFWRRVFHKENESLFFYLMERRIIPEWMYKIHYATNKWEGRVLRLTHCPQLLFRRFVPRNVIKGYKKLRYDVCELEKLLSNEKCEKNGFLISIAMVTYNGERYLREQLDSILRQTIKVPIEIVVCDDGSIDGTRKILQDYAASDPRFRLFFNQKTLGIVKNYEKAISLCNGEYIALADQDDIWEKNKLERLLAAIRDKDFVLSNALLVDWNNRPMAVTMKNACNYNFVPEDKTTLFKRLLHQNFVQGAAILARSSFLKGLPPVPSAVDGHDYWFALNACTHNGFSYLDECTVRYRRHKSASSSVDRRLSFLKELIRFSFSQENYKENCLFVKNKINLCKAILNSSLQLSNRQKKYLEKTLVYYERGNDRSFSSFIYFLMNCWVIYLDKNVLKNSFRIMKNFCGVLVWKLFLRKKMLA